jgi:hypothetical protein
MTRLSPTTEMLPEDLREDEPTFGHSSRRRRTHHGLNDQISCRRLVRRSCRHERALAPREIASAFGRKEHLLDAHRSHAHDDSAQNFWHSSTFEGQICPLRGSSALLMKLACLSLPRMRCQKCPTSILLIRPWSDMLLPDRRELLADYSLVQVMLNDQHPNTAGVIHFQPSDHFRGREAHADVTAEMRLSRTSSA